MTSPAWVRKLNAPSMSLLPPQIVSIGINKANMDSVKCFLMGIQAGCYIALA